MVQLHLDAPSVLKEARRSFRELVDSIYANKKLGLSGQIELMMCECGHQQQSEFSRSGRSLRTHRHRHDVKQREEDATMRDSDESSDNGSDANSSVASSETPSSEEEEDDDEEEERMCGPNSSCINRMTYMECYGEDCGCSPDTCANRRFQNHEHAKIDVFRAGSKGYGVRAAQDIPKSSFIYEYTGEVLDEPRFIKRQQKYDREGVKHFYFMMLQKDEFIDATEKGSLARFCNHSCNPNAAIEKWTVGPKLRMGLFAKRDILKGEEICFDYKVDRYGSKAQPCYCGESNCSGFLGGRTQTGGAILPPSVIAGLGLDLERAFAWHENSLQGLLQRLNLGPSDLERVLHLEPKELPSAPDAPSERQRVLLLRPNLRPYSEAPPSVGLLGDPLNNLSNGEPDEADSQSNSQSNSNQLNSNQPNSQPGNKQLSNKQLRSWQRRSNQLKNSQPSKSSPPSPSSPSSSQPSSRLSEADHLSKLLQEQPEADPSGGQLNRLGGLPLSLHQSLEKEAALASSRSSQSLSSTSQSESADDRPNQNPSTSPAPAPGSAQPPSSESAGGHQSPSQQLSPSHAPEDDQKEPPKSPSPHATPSANPPMPTRAPTDSSRDASGAETAAAAAAAAAASSSNSAKPSSPSAPTEAENATSASPSAPAAGRAKSSWHSPSPSSSEDEQENEQDEKTAQRAAARRARKIDLIALLDAPPSWLNETQLAARQYLLETFVPLNAVQVDALPEFMRVLMQTQDGAWLIFLMLQRVLQTAEMPVQRAIMNMHGYEIIGAVLNRWRLSDEVVESGLAVLQRWPKSTKNKISSSKIEAVVAEIRGERGKDSPVGQQAASLLEEWGGLAMGYRIPRRKVPVKSEADTSTTDGSAIASGSGDMSTDTGRAGGASSASSTSGSSFGTTAPTRKRKLLPPGWEAQTSEDGRTFYVHAEENLFSWQPPPDLRDVEREAKQARREAEQERMRIEAAQRERELQASEIQRIINEAQASIMPSPDGDGRPKHKSRSSKKSGKKSGSGLDTPRDRTPAGAESVQAVLAAYIPKLVFPKEAELGRERCKRHAREIVHILAKKEEAKRRNDKPYELTAERKQKIKVFVKDYLSKLLSRHANRDAPSTEAPAQEA